LPQLPAAAMTGAEVTYNYRYESNALPRGRTRCCCGAASCSGWLGGLDLSLHLAAELDEQQQQEGTRVQRQVDGGLGWGSGARGVSRALQHLTAATPHFGTLQAAMVAVHVCMSGVRMVAAMFELFLPLKQRHCKVKHAATTSRFPQEIVGENLEILEKIGNPVG